MTILVFTPNGEVIVSENTWLTAVIEVEEESYMVDTTYGSSEEIFRYGRAINKQWQSVPFSDFPNEFKTHLLLLGVS